MDAGGAAAPPVVERIVGAIERTPGLSIQEVARAAGVSRTAAIYHLRRLAKEGRIRQVRTGRTSLSFPASVQDPRSIGILAAIRQRTARLVLESVAAEPNLSNKELARRLAITPRGVRWHRQRLEAQGLIQMVAEDGGRLLRDGPLALHHFDAKGDKGLQ